MLPYKLHVVEQIAKKSLKFGSKRRIDIDSRNKIWGLFIFRQPLRDQLTGNPTSWYAIKGQLERLVEWRHEMSRAFLESSNRMMKEERSGRGRSGVKDEGGGRGRYLQFRRAGLKNIILALLFLSLLPLIEAVISWCECVCVWPNVRTKRAD